MSGGLLMEVCVDSVESALNAERGDFLYSECEQQVMKNDVQQMKEHGADGLVRESTFTRHLPQRVLTSGGENTALEGLPIIKRLVEQAKGRISVMPGTALIHVLHCSSESARAGIISASVSGGGITDRNLLRILEGSGSQEFHCSARTSRDSSMKYRNNTVCMGGSLTVPEYSLKVTDVNKVRALNAIAQNTL
ncbi:hypothetical protein DNTS_021759 [Danionella cerebrum]|uniref:Copper homeostasis protein cutC homolog n=1 Tax=Danionella cerebrum TaxID=2873325 RepID=A0A553QNP6_9TELE|nr:hypothetical protein DNTS_021759 [Danionella translucida]